MLYYFVLLLEGALDTRFLCPFPGFSRHEAECQALIRGRGPVGRSKSLLLLLSYLLRSKASKATVAHGTKSRYHASSSATLTSWQRSASRICLQLTVHTD